MASVFLVSEGSYSDYHIVHAFSTREGAEVFLNGHEGNEQHDYAIEEMILDEPVTDRLMALYPATIEVGTGYVKQYKQPHFKVRDPSAGCDISKPEYPFTSLIYSYGYRPMTPSIYVASPISFEHAVKVAVEQRQQFLREHNIQAEASSQPAQS